MNSIGKTSPQEGHRDKGDVRYKGRESTQKTENWGDAFYGWSPTWPFILNKVKIEKLVSIRFLFSGGRSRTKKTCHALELLIYKIKKCCFKVIFYFDTDLT